MEIGLKHEFLSSKAEDEDDEQRNYKTVRPSYKVKVLGDGIKVRGVTALLPLLFYVQVVSS